MLEHRRHVWQHSHRRSFRTLARHSRAQHHLSITNASFRHLGGICKLTMDGCGNFTALTDAAFASLLM